MRKRCPEAHMEDWKMLIRNKDEKLTNGWLTPIEKPEKNIFQARRYRPVLLLSVYWRKNSKLVMQIVCPVLDRQFHHPTMLTWLGKRQKKWYWPRNYLFPRQKRKTW